MGSTSEEIINLETPPPSPVQLWQDIEAADELGYMPVEYHISSPQKRPREYSARPRQSKRTRQQHVGTERYKAVDQELNTTTSPRLGAHAPQTLIIIAHYQPMHTRYENTVPPIELQHECPANDDLSEMLPTSGYEEYVESVKAGIAGVYQIEQNVFVVQGWDCKTLSATVSLMM